MMVERRVTIIGCGLIGGSIGMALKRSRPEWEVSAVDLPEALPAIREAGFADFVGTMEEASETLADSALIILATPVELIPGTLKLLAPHLREGTLVTDVGGAKRGIVECARETLPPGVVFIGGHPVAGSEGTGIGAADPLLFKGRVYVLCPEPDTSAESLLLLIDMVEDLLAVPLTLEPEEHDRILAMVSHTPQLLSIALVHAAMEQDSVHRLLDVTVGPGFLDLTRIAASSFEQWRGVLELNKEVILAALDRFERSLAIVRESLVQGELADLWTSVSGARRRMTPEVSSRRRTPDLRLVIDQHDERILKALSDRLSTVKQVGALKTQRSEAVHDPDRERRLFAARVEWGRTLGLPEEVVHDLFEVIVKHSRAAQE